jgi:hypothetical protein
VLPLNGNQLIAIEPVYNLALKHTHGYGVVAVPVNEMDERGNPLLWAHDIPAKAKGDLVVAYGAIYYGALTRDPPTGNSTFRRVRPMLRRYTTAPTGSPFPASGLSRSLFIPSSRAPRN